MQDPVRRLGLAPIWIVLALAACSRDLDVPSTRALVVTPAAASAAPRQRLALAASGGAGGYRFGFAAGGRQSGPDATVDASTGAYQAGAIGPAQDVVEVSDAAGATVQARIAVGPRISVTPVASSVAPGGTVELQVDGGLPSAEIPGGGTLGYAFELADASTGSSLVQNSPTTATYRASRVAAGMEEKILVRDATRDPAATAVARVRVGDVLQVYPANVVVAPNESIQLLAFGGQQPYEFTLETATSGTGASVNLLTGVYRAGANEGGGTALDTVLVTDDNGETVTVYVAVTPPLRLDPLSSDVRPGKATQLVARGGKPPYAFSFAAKGNRSHGTVDAITGAYVPGWNVGAVDLLQVTDAAGAVAALAEPRKVGPVRVRVGTGTFRCLTAPLDGPPSDVVLMRADSTGAKRLLTTVRFSADGLPVVEDAYVPDLGPAVAAMDSDGDFHSELAFLQNGVTSLVADPGGRLDYGPALSMTASGRTFVGGTVTKDASGAFNAAVLDELVTSVATTVSCAGAWMNVIDWDPAGASTRCRPAPSAVTAAFPDATAMVEYAVTVGASRYSQLLWLKSGSANAAWDVAGRTGTWTGPSSVAFPASHSFKPAGGVENALLRVDRGAAVLLDDKSSPTLLRRKVAVVAPDPSFALTLTTPVDPFDASDPAASGIARWADDRILAWDGVTSTLAGFTIGAGGALSRQDPVLAAPPSFGISCATLGDVNGDGTADLVVAGKGSADADILWGDSGGSFGTLARFAIPGPAAIAHLDGDLAEDLVVGTDAPSLATLWGVETAPSIAGRQLAWGPETSVDGVPDVLVAGDFLGSGTSLLYQDKSGTFRIAAAGEGGLFDPGVVLGPAPGTLAFDTPVWSLWANPWFPTWFPQPFLVAADLGGAAPGLDFWSAQTSAFESWLHVFLRTATAEIAHYESPHATFTTGCAFGAISRSPSKATPSFVAVCAGNHATNWTVRTLGFDPVSRTFDAWQPRLTFSGWGMGPAGVTVAGTPSGEAWFVAPSGSGYQLVTVGEALAPTIVALPMGYAGPVDAAHLGDLDGDGADELAVSAAGNVWLLESVAGAWQVAATGQSAGRVFGILRAGPGKAGAVVMLAGRELLLLTREGATLR